MCQHFHTRILGNRSDPTSKAECASSWKIDSWRCRAPETNIAMVMLDAMDASIGAAPEDLHNVIQIQESHLALYYSF